MGKKMCFVVGVGLTITALSAFTGCEKAKAPSAGKKSDVVASIGQESITLKDVDERISKLPPYYQNMLKDRKRELVDDMVLEILLYNEAKQRGYQNDKEVKDLLREAEKKIVISKLIKDAVEVKTNVSDKEVEEYYNAHKEEFSVPERWKASHILVKTEAEAKGALDELSKGKSFEDAAKEKSQDASAKKGGDLGYFTRGQMVPEFEEAATKLEIGQTSGVVKSQFGFHIVKLTDKRPASTQELSDASARIKNNLLSTKRREAFDKLVADLKTKTKVAVNETLLKPEKTEGPAPEVQEAPSLAEEKEQVQGK
ncbi:MAG: peptidylprolyl isomerase [Candidatus Omnitrophica bacterium]|nr:peptidylprolyl isomerase [Candidatus Omnitrophota bacterium]